MDKNGKGLTYVGKPLSREDAVAKVTGAARFVHDLALPGMLHAAMLTSPHPAARIVRIDTTRTHDVAGVRAILVGDDLDYRLGLYIRDKPILARGVARYQGEPVAAVAADTPDVARAACQRIKVEYEPLPAVFDPREAMSKSAPLVHENLHTYEYMQGVFSPKPHSNIAHHQRIRFGDVTQGMPGAELVAKETFYTPPVQHVPMETHAVIAQTFPDDRIEVHSSCQSPYTVRHLLSV